MQNKIYSVNTHCRWCRNEDVTKKLNFVVSDEIFVKSKMFTRCSLTNLHFRGKFIALT